MEEAIGRILQKKRRGTSLVRQTNEQRRMASTLVLLSGFVAVVVVVSTGGKNLVSQFPPLIFRLFGGVVLDYSMI